MQQLLNPQYELIKGARTALFDYCGSMDADDLYKPIGQFNNANIAGLLLHNVDTYIGWLGNFGMDRSTPLHKAEDIKSLDEIKELFEKVNALVTEFLEKYAGDFEQPVTGMVKHRGFSTALSPLQLFTHVITHEFHHKGQILTMSRLLGYIPVDTDVIRT